MYVVIHWQGFRCNSNHFWEVEKKPHSNMSQEKKQDNKIWGEDTSLFCFSWSFSWSGYFGLYFWIIVFKVCPSQAAWSGTLLSIGEWTDVTKHLKSDLSSVLEAVHVYQNLKPCLAWSSNFVYATNVYNATCL